MKLNAYLKENNLTQKEFLQNTHQNFDTRFSYHALVKWCSGKRIPRPEEMSIIYKATNGVVTPNDFYSLH
jgi:hypothetical protein|tara:strand:- start:7 stop:216 length:210 start_codon:yes stop_codon:yes gene_type:complete